MTVLIDIRGATMEQKEWHWNGSLWSFIEIVQWALVFHRLGTEKPPKWNEIMASPELVLSKAEEYGMTLRTIAMEMVKCGNAAIKLLDCMGARQTDELNTEEECD